MAYRDRQPRTLTMQVAFEHLPYRSTSVSTVEFPSYAPIGRLKEEMFQRVKVHPQLQQWYYKGKELHNDDTIVKLNLQRDAIIFIKQTASLHELHGGVQERDEEGELEISKAT